MKWIAIIAFLVSLSSCIKQDEEKIKILSAKVNGKEIQFAGLAQRYTDIRNGNAFRYVYYIYNLETPQIDIQAVDSTFVRTYFDFPDFANVQYSYIDSLGNVKSYEAVNGEMSFTKEEDGILFGEFSFILVNIRDVTDTLIVSDGYFELTLDEYDRLWQN